jgi:hypothetical protein
MSQLVKIKTAYAELSEKHKSLQAKYEALLEKLEEKQLLYHLVYLPTNGEFIPSTKVYPTREMANNKAPEFQKQAKLEHNLIPFDQGARMLCLEYEVIK